MCIRLFTAVLFSLLIIQAFASSNLMAKTETDTYYIKSFERLVEEQRYDIAAQLLEKNKKQLVKSAAGINDKSALLLKQYMEDNITILQSDTKTPTEKTIATKQTIILWDAIVYENAPLWMTWKQELESKMDRLLAQEEVDSSDLTEIAYYVTVLSPVAQLHLDDDQFKSYQQSIYLLSKDHNNYNEIEIEETFAQISQLNIDTWSKANAHYTHWLIFIVMGFIFLSLSYVAWAKYKAETTG